MQAVPDRADRVRSASKPDRVEVALAYLIDPLQQLIDVVVFGVQVAAGERVIAAGRELADEFRSEFGRRPRRIVGNSARGQLRPHQAGTEEKDGNTPRELVRQHLAVATRGSLARRIRGALAGGQVGRSAT